MTNNPETALKILAQYEKVKTAKKKVDAEEKKLRDLVKSNEQFNTIFLFKGKLYKMTAHLSYNSPKVTCEPLGEASDIQKMIEEGK